MTHGCYLICCLSVNVVLQQTAAPPQTFSMPVTVQASNQSTLHFSNPGSALVTTSYVTSSSLTDTHLLSPQQPALQRNTVSPGLPQRPASAGEHAARRSTKRQKMICSRFLHLLRGFFLYHTWVIGLNQRC